MRDFHMTETQAMKYPLVRAFALCAFNQLSNPWCEMDIAGDGYIAQESYKLKQ